MNGSENPSRFWWVGHIVMGVITGLVVYILYREKNPAAAKRHLVGSVMIHVVLAGISVAAMLAVGASV